LDRKLYIIDKYDLFGEEDLINKNITRNLSVQCTSLEGSLIMINVSDFLDEILSHIKIMNYLKKRVLDKMKIIEERV